MDAKKIITIAGTRIVPNRNAAPRTLKPNHDALILLRPKNSSVPNALTATETRHTTDFCDTAKQKPSKTPATNAGRTVSVPPIKATMQSSHNGSHKLLGAKTVTSRKYPLNNPTPSIAQIPARREKR